MELKGSFTPVCLQFFCIKECSFARISTLISVAIVCLLTAEVLSGDRSAAVLSGDMIAAVLSGDRIAAVVSRERIAAQGCKE